MTKTPNTVTEGMPNGAQATLTWPAGYPTWTQLSTEEQVHIRFLLELATSIIEEAAA